MFRMSSVTDEQLASVRASIANLEAALRSGGDATEEYTIGGRRWRRGEIAKELAVLYARETELLKRGNRPRGPVISVASARRPPGGY